MVRSKSKQPPGVKMVREQHGAKTSAVKEEEEEEAGGGEEDHYKVEKIVDHWTKNKFGVPLYRTRWKGYTAKDDTWEPAANVSSTGHL